MWDLIVVGAGPVGCYLGREFSKNGLDVLILEEHEEIGKPMACSGHISNLIWNFIPKREDLIENRIRGAIFHVGDKKYVFGKNQVQSYVINREELDKYMAEMAREEGVKILASHEVREIFNTDSHVTVYAENNGELKNFQSKILAGCDGANSNVRKSIGIKNKNPIYGLLCYVDGDGSQSYVDVYPPKTKDFFAWRIPREKTVEYGLASKYQGENYDNLLSFLNEFGLDEDEVNSFHSGKIPQELSSKLTRKRIFLAGDSGGTVKPFTGGGIIYGLTSIKLASELISIENPNSLKKYEGAVNKVLKQDIMAGKLIKKFYRFPPLIQNSFLNIMNKKIGNFHMDKPSKIFMNIIKN